MIGEEETLLKLRSLSLLVNEAIVAGDFPEVERLNVEWQKMLERINCDKPRTPSLLFLNSFEEILLEVTKSIEKMDNEMACLSKEVTKKLSALKKYKSV